MEDEKQDSGWSVGIGLGLGALVTVLISAIIGMLRLSRPKENSTKSLSTKVSAANRAPDLPQGGSVSTLAVSATPTKTSAVPPSPEESTPPVTSTRWTTGTKYFVSAVLFLAFLGLLYISSASMSTIIFAGLLTFIVHPAIKFFQRRFKMQRGAATGITYLLVLVLIILIPILIIPSIVEAINFIANYDFTIFIENLSTWLSQQAENLAAIPVIGESISSTFADLAAIFSNLDSPSVPTSPSGNVSVQELGGRIAQTVGFLVSIFGPLISIAFTVVFTLLISLHMSLSVSMMREGFKKLVPSAYEDELTALIRQIISIWQSFLRGQLSLMVIVGVLVWLGNEIIGTPQAVFLGIVAGLLEVIPNLGPILATIPAVILALLFGSQTSFLHLDQLENWAFALVVIGLYVVVQIIENQLLVPYVLGDAVDLPPLIVIVGVVIGGSAFGILGVFLATPVISTGREVFMYLYDKILEPPPEPEPPEPKLSLMEALRGFAKRIPRPNFRRGKPVEPAGINEETPIS